MKLKLEIEVDYNPDTMHGSDSKAIAWFRDDVLLNPAEDERLILHSNCIGDEIGEVRVTRIISGLPMTAAQEYCARCGKTKLTEKPTPRLTDDKQEDNIAL